MFIRLYLDENIQRGLTAALRARHYDAVSVHDVGRQGLPDAEQLAQAAATERALLSFNAADFLRLHREWIGIGRPHWGIIVSEQLPVGEVIRRLLYLLNRVTADEIRGQIYWLQRFR